MLIKTLRIIYKVLSKIQLYSYLLPTTKIGNKIMDWRMIIINKIWEVQ